MHDESNTILVNDNETQNEAIVEKVTKALRQHVGPKLPAKKAHKPCAIEQVVVNFDPILEMTYVGGIPMSYNNQYEATIVGNVSAIPPPRGPDRKQRKRRDCPICKKSKDEGCDGGRPGPIARGKHLYCKTTNQIVRSGLASSL